MSPFDSLFVSTVGKLIEGLTRKVFGPLVGTVVLGLALIIFLIETGDTELETYAKAAVVLKNLEDLASSNNQDVVSASETIAGQVKDIVASAADTDRLLSEGGHRTALALVMGLPWAAFSLVGIVEGIRREPDWEYGFLGCLALAALLGIGAYAIPTDIHWFYRYLLIPIGVHLLLGVFFVACDDEADESGVQ